MLLSLLASHGPTGRIVPALPAAAGVRQGQGRGGSRHAARHMHSQRGEQTTKSKPPPGNAVPTPAQQQHQHSSRVTHCPRRTHAAHGPPLQPHTPRPPPWKPPAPQRWAPAAPRCRLSWRRPAPPPLQTWAGAGARLSAWPAARAAPAGPAACRAAQKAPPRLPAPPAAAAWAAGRAACRRALPPLRPAQGLAAGASAQPDCSPPHRHPRSCMGEEGRQGQSCELPAALGARRQITCTHARARKRPIDGSPDRHP